MIYPVGMLTADEVILAGIGYNTSNASQDSYLYSGYNYWTMTPYSNGLTESNLDDTSYNIQVTQDGYWVYHSTGSPSYIRPSISLNSGTIEHPYEVVME